MPIYGDPVDQRLLSSFRRQMGAFERALSLRPRPLSPLRIPFEGTTMPAWLIPAAGREDERRPMIIFTNGYDGTLTDMYFGSAAEASRRDYHCLIFDGPGQGEMLYEQGIPMRPDWESVVAKVVDFVQTLPNVDTDRIAISGWSLGDYLAPRAASGEPRIAACIADPGQWSIAGAFRESAIRMGVPSEQADSLSDVDDALLQRLEAIIMADRRLRWSAVQRGYWVHGATDLRGFLRSIEGFTMDGRVESITCLTLVTLAEQDPLASDTEAFFNALQCQKTLMRFSATEGAGDHCEMRNRSLLNHRVLDWLDEVFGGVAEPLRHMQP